MAVGTADRRNASIEAARQRRLGIAGEKALRTEWFIEQVEKHVKMKMKSRVRLATEYVKNKVIVNISRPVTKTVVGRRTIVSDRSKPGEFPKADTTQLMKTIFSDYKESENSWEGYIGTPLWYGLELELAMNRSFLLRTFYEEYGTIRRILTGPIE